MVGHRGSSAGSHLADPTSPISSHYPVIIQIKSVPVHQLSGLEFKEFTWHCYWCKKHGNFFTFSRFQISTEYKVIFSAFYSQTASKGIPFTCHNALNLDECVILMKQCCISKAHATWNLIWYQCITLCFLKDKMLKKVIPGKCKMSLPDKQNTKHRKCTLCFPQCHITSLRH